MTLREKLNKDVVLLDGAFGTYLKSLYGEIVETCPETLSLEKPEIIKRIHADYFQAGSDSATTNTFGANRIKLDEYGLSGHVKMINIASVKIAKEAAKEYSKKNHPKYVMGSIGPTGKLPSSSDISLGSISYDEIYDVFLEQADALIEGGVDAILIETGQDVLEMKAALNASKQAASKSKKDIVILTHFTLSNNGRMLLGTDPLSAAVILSSSGADVVGLNCSLGPIEMESAIKIFSKNCSTYISCVPNAGLPKEKDGKVVYDLGAEEMAGVIEKFLKKYGMNVVGGCCGTTPEHIKLIREKIDNLKTSKTFKLHQINKTTPTLAASAYECINISSEKKPVNIGERINTQGSKKTKELIMAKDYDSIVELGKLQQEQGALVLDVCAVLTERETEKEDSLVLVKKLSQSVKIPLMVDSTDVEVLENSVKNYPGTAFINSINLENGEDKADKIFSLAKKHGSFVVCLTIDEKGMARDVDRKVGIAGRIYDIGVNRHGLNPYQLLFDTLTFSLGTGEEEYAESAIATFEAIKAIKKKFPGVMTVLGASNVSFGLPPEGRKILNAIYLEHAARYGLDMAILNPQALLNYDDIPEKERTLTENLIFNKKPKALDKFVEYFINVKTEEKKKEEADKDISIEQKIKNCILNRKKNDIVPLLETALKDNTAEDIVNNILLEAMKEVGGKLDSGEMVLPYVLQSAEVMRAAIDHLEKYFDKEKDISRGKVLLATVFGDVHDIGKNLVKMILENNGFTVIDLGKQVKVETIIDEAKKNNVDAVGLSALLVETSRQMKTCIKEMHKLGLNFPVILGGAPINDNFAKDAARVDGETKYAGGVCYAKDAFTGLKIVQDIVSVKNAGIKKKLDPHPVILSEAKEQSPTPNEEGTGSKVKGEDAKDEGVSDREEENHTETTEDVRRTPPVILSEAKDQSPTEVSDAAKDHPVPSFHGIRTLKNIPIDDVFEYLNKDMLFNFAWGAKIKDKAKMKELHEKEFPKILSRLKDECIQGKWLELKAVYGFFKVLVKGDDIIVLSEETEVIEGITVPDICPYLATRNDGTTLVAFQAVTIGEIINIVLTEMNQAKAYSEEFYLHGLGAHLAEALADYVHDRIREEVGVEKDFGKRYSPGYPKWGNIKDQKKIFNILKVTENIGLRLTQGYQIEPEQSTTAIIIFNDKAAY
ncbi:MAG: homocysteine S-methyltransferase family protein [Candidatus Omnitrophica bacterium]|nr:homocysteine S-methyltransferase family protein [Candidatus Omnitrophota bacterium]